MSLLPPPSELSHLITKHDAVRVMTDITADRARTWEILAALVSPPEEALVARLTGGGLSAGLLAATQWLQENWTPAGMRELRALERSVDGHGPDAVLAELRGHRTDVAAAADELTATCTGIAQQCRTELTAWREGRKDDAKRLRVEQMPVLGPDAPIRRAAAALAATEAPTYPAFAQLVTEYLRLETGV